MAAGTRLRCRLVVLAIAMAREAGRAVALGPGFVRRVARRAGRVLRDRVEPWQLRDRVAARARRRRRRAVRTMRAMAGRTVGDGSAVLGLRLVGVAGRAAHRLGFRIVRRVAALAPRVPRGRGRCLGLVAGGAERGRRRRFRAVRAMTAAAIGVARRQRRPRRPRVAARARGSGDSRLACVWRVTREARGRRVVLGGVAGRAVDGLRGGGERVRVRWVTADAVAPGVADRLLMARRARARCIRVRGVARRARRVLRGSEHRLIAMAARARLHLGLPEAMRRMTAGAARVAVGQRAGVRRVAVRAALIRGVLGLVHAVAVEAAVQAGVPGLLGRVAARAWPGIE